MVPVPAENRAALPLAPVCRSLTLAEQAYANLRTSLRQGVLLPGERLSTRKVAATLTVSLTPAREALNRLVAERLLEQRLDRTIVVPVLTRGRYDEICAVRLELEPLAARLACRTMGPAQLARLQRLYAAHEAAWLRRDTKGALGCNEDFHFTIYGAAQNRTLLLILEALWLQIGPSLNLLFPHSYEAGWKGGEHHRSMMQAIRAGDAAALVKALRRDLSDGRRLLDSVLPER
ncbi:MAG: GntR family transcriptional regulator [Acetobacteraceae bacterium]